MFGSCMRWEFQIIVPRSVNNEIFIGDYFKSRIQVLQPVTDAVSLLGGGLDWCIGKKSEKFPCIVSSEDKHQLFSLGGNCKHNCRTKIDAASSDRPFPPSNKIFNAKADRQRQFSSIVSDEDKHKVRPLLSIKITGQTLHTQLRSTACMSPRHLLLSGWREI